MLFPNKNQLTIKHAIEPTQLDKRDFSLNKTLKLAGTSIQIPDNFNLDANLYPAPNQNVPNDFFDIPALPYGCTEYAVNELCTDEDGIPYNPIFTEGKIHANAKGGIDLRTALASVCTDGVLANSQMPIDFFSDTKAMKKKRMAYFRVGQNPDYFDGFRTAMFANKRSIVVGTPWFSEWLATDENAIVSKVFKFIAGVLPWHAWKICGSEMINGELYLLGKPWLGIFYGSNGLAKWSRDQINGMMSIAGSAAFTVAKPDPADIQTVGVTYIFKKDLSYGMTGVEDIAPLQNALQSLGYTIIHATTTNYLLETKIALAKFQKDQGIVDDGSHFGPLTRYAMNRILNPSQNLYGSIQLFVQTFLGL